MIKQIRLIFVYHLIILMLLTSRTNLYAKYTLKEKSICFKIKTGERVSDICKRLSIYGICSTSSLLNIASKEPFNEYEFVPSPRNSINRFEGLFTPGNYKIKINARDYLLNPYKTTLHLITFLLTKSKNRFKFLHENKLLTAYQQIILASIVEKEAVSHRYYCQIASVFYNRLKANMPLASCPTLEYALGYHRPFLTRRDVMYNSPYNLYIHRKLPPTPIATFSDHALWCVEHPMKTNFYFFVYDWVTGDLYFSSNYSEHKKNVLRAQRNFIKKYGKNKLFKKYINKFYEP